MERKLVRDGYKHLPPLPGTKITTVESEEDLVDSHIEKLDEEARELIEAIFDGEGKKIAVEAGDLMQVIISLAALKGVSENEINTARKEKLERLGGFDEGVILITRET